MRRVRAPSLVVALLLALMAVVADAAPAVAAAANSFKPMVPARFFDTRLPGQAALGPGEVRNVQITGRGGIPAGAVAVALNVTVTGPTSGGFLSVYPGGTPFPGSSNLNFGPGQTVPNMVMVGLGANGQISVLNSNGWTQVIIDVSGWFSGGFNPITPARFLDTRSVGQTPIGPGETRNVQVSGRSGIPAGASVALNVTVTSPTSSGYLSLYPAGTAFPGTSNLNFGPGQTVPNMVLVGLGANGRITVFNSSGSTHVIIDVAGWFSGGFDAVKPSRLADTRGGLCCVRLGHGDKRSIAILGRGGVPNNGVTAVALNVTVTAASAGGYVTVYPKGNPLPGSSNLNFSRDQTVPNLVTTGLGYDGAITIYNAWGTVDVIVDVTGYFDGTSSAQPLFDCAVVAPEAPQAPAGFAIPAGSWNVPSQVPPGRYVAPGGPGCVWQRLRSFSGQPGDLLATGGGAPRTIVDLLPGDKGFFSAGCGTWFAQVAPLGPTTVVPDGDWVVSEEMVPGVYQSSAAAPCRWEQLTAFTGEPEDLLDDGVAAGIAYVEIATFEVGFRSRGCGSWRWIGPPVE